MGRVAPADPATLERLERLESARSRVVALVAELGRDEVAVLELIAEGLARGRAIYGELDVAADRRDFVGEARDELRDALVYFGAHLVRLERRKVPPCR